MRDAEALDVRQHPVRIEAPGEDNGRTEQCADVLSDQAQTVKEWCHCDVDAFARDQRMRTAIRGRLHSKPTEFVEFGE